MTILNLGQISPLQLKYPGWFDVHRNASQDPLQKPDAFCPICREIIGAEAQNKLQAAKIQEMNISTQLHSEILVSR